MSRKSITVTIEVEKRDHGKKFLLTEKPAVQAEKWATRALMAISRSGVHIDEDALGSGMAGLFLLGLKAVMTCSYEDAEPLLDEMMDCVQFIPSAEAGPRPLHETDIEEAGTILFLRNAVLELHTGFSIAATLSTLGMAAKRQGELSLSPDLTSPAPSPPSSQAS